MKKTKKLAFGGMPAPMAKPMRPSMGPKPQIMGGSSNKMGPDSMKRGVPSNPANMSIAKPPGLTGAGVTKFTGPPSIKTAKNFEGLTPPGVQRFTGPMSTGPRYDKPSKMPAINPNNPNVIKNPNPPTIINANKHITPPGVQRFTGPMSKGPRFDKPTMSTAPKNDVEIGKFMQDQDNKRRAMEKAGVAKLAYQQQPVMLPDPKNKVGISEEDRRMGELRTAEIDAYNKKIGKPTIYDTPQKLISPPRAMLKAGGAVKVSQRGDGIAQRGKTKGRMV